MEREAGVRCGLSAAEGARQARIHSGSVTGTLESIRHQRGLYRHRGHRARARRRPEHADLHAAGWRVAEAAPLSASRGSGARVRRKPAQPRISPVNRRFSGVPKEQPDPRKHRAVHARGSAAHARRSAGAIAGCSRFGDLFPTPGIAPMRGRNFTESETRSIRHVVILSNRLWKSRFSRGLDIAGGHSAGADSSALTGQSFVASRRSIQFLYCRLLS